MSTNLVVCQCHHHLSKTMIASMSSTAAATCPGGLISTNTRPRAKPTRKMLQQQNPAIRNISFITTQRSESGSLWRVRAAASGGGVPLPPLDLTEENIQLVLADARVELAQLFDTSVGITGQVELAELDGPFVKISLKGRFWHKRSTVVARVGNYLKQRIPEILEVDIEDEKQLDDSPANF